VSEKLVTIEHRPRTGEAEICRLRLEAEGIRCVLEAADAFTWLWGNVGRVKIKVAEEDAERAREILATPVEISDEDWQAGEDSENDEEEARSGLTAALVLFLRIALPAAIVFILVFLLLNLAGALRR